MHFKHSLWQVTNVALPSLQSIIPGSSSSPINTIQNEMNHQYLMASFLQLLENRFWRALGCEQWSNDTIHHFLLETEKVPDSLNRKRINLWSHIRLPHRKAVVLVLRAPEGRQGEKTNLRIKHGLVPNENTFKKNLYKEILRTKISSSFERIFHCRSRWKWLRAKAGLRRMV